MSEMKNEAILPYPAQNAFTRDIRQKAAQQGRAQYLSLWAGQGVGQLRPMPARELVDVLVAEARSALGE
jgi:nitronate monooxygenase